MLKILLIVFLMLKANKYNSCCKMLLLFSQQQQGKVERKIEKIRET